MPLLRIGPDGSSATASMPILFTTNPANGSRLSSLRRWVIGYCLTMRRLVNGPGGERTAFSVFTGAASNAGSGATGS